MNNQAINRNIAKHVAISGCGRDRMMAELTPLFDCIWDDYQHLFLLRTNTEYLMSHEDALDCFLNNAGYHYISYPGKEYKTNFEEFINCVKRTINNHNLDVDDERFISKTILMLHEYLYDTEAERMICTEKARYLIKTLKESILEIEDAGSDTGINVRVARIYADDILSYLNDMDQFLVELGFPPEIPGVSNVSGFADYIVDYINSGKFIEDRFLSGEGILRKFNYYIHPIDWYSQV